jgi:hypothetical protein
LPRTKQRLYWELSALGFYVVSRLLLLVVVASGVLSACSSGLRPGLMTTQIVAVQVHGHGQAVAERRTKSKSLA